MYKVGKIYGSSKIVRRGWGQNFSWGVEPPFTLLNKKFPDLESVPNPKNVIQIKNTNSKSSKNKFDLFVSRHHDLNLLILT